jgi:uncharacterized membrane protein
VLDVLAVWLHTLAFVIALGYYGILGRIVLPTLERTLDGTGQARTLMALERRAVPLILLSAVLFVGTGTYLLFIDPRYGGLGSFTANTWSTLMLIKHLVVAALVVLAVVVDVLIRDLAWVTDETDRVSSLRRLRWALDGTTGLGALIVLLTAAAQVAE